MLIGSSGGDCDDDAVLNLQDFSGFSNVCQARRRFRRYNGYVVLQWNIPVKLNSSAENVYRYHTQCELHFSIPPGTPKRKIHPYSTRQRLGFSPGSNQIRPQRVFSDSSAYFLSAFPISTSGALEGESFAGRHRPSRRRLLRLA